MTKCKHKGECICGKHPKEETKIVTVNGVQYFERTIIDETIGNLHFLSLVEEEETIHPDPGFIEFLDPSYIKDFSKSCKESTTIQKPNQVHANSTEKIKS